MTTLSDFTIATPRPLPVIVLADISGSMSENGKIDSLNHALDEMIKSFATEAQDRAESLVCPSCKQCACSAHSPQDDTLVEPG